MGSSSDRLRIATRASELALWQANHVADLLRERYPELTIELVDVTTQGDADQTQPLWQMGGTGVFTKEVQRVLLEGAADLAVHSLKDLPTEITDPGLALAAVPARECRWDALILPADSALQPDAESPLDCLPLEARIGTGSLRRQAQLRRLRPDLQLLEIRGNLNTRLRKLDAGEYDALILASAGVLRLGWEQRLSCRLCPPVMLPAVGQGALGLECRADDETTRSLLDALNDPSTRIETAAERSLLAQLRAGCHAPVGVDTRYTNPAGSSQGGNAQLQLTGVVLSPDGSQRIEATQEVTFPATDDWHNHLPHATELGRSTAQELLQQGARDLIELK